MILTTAVALPEETDPCRTAQDLVGLSARISIGQTLRTILDQQGLTPFELLFDWRHLRRFGEASAAADAMVQRLAAAQARQIGQPVEQRRAELVVAIEQVMQTARRTEKILSTVPDGTSALAAVTAMPATADGPGDLVRAALARDLSDKREWAAKLEHVLGIVWRVDDDRVTAACDDVLADLIQTPAATRILFSGSESLGDHLLHLCGLVHGEAAVSAGRLGQSQATSFTALLRQERLPETRRAALDRVRRLLITNEALASQAAGREADYFARIVERLVSSSGVAGGTAMAEALTRRFARRLNQGGATGLRLAINGLAEMLTDLLARLSYLNAVSHAAFAARHLSDVAASMEAAFGNERLVEPLLLGGGSPDSPLDKLEAVLAAIRMANLPEAVQQHLHRKARRMADDFVGSGHLLERLPLIEPNAVRRSYRIAGLLQSGLIRDDRNIARLRRHLAEQVRLLEGRESGPIETGVAMADATVEPVDLSAPTEVRLATDGAMGITVVKNLNRPAAAPLKLQPGVRPDAGAGPRPALPDVGPGLGPDSSADGLAPATLHPSTIDRRRVEPRLRAGGAGPRIRAAATPTRSQVTVGPTEDRSLPAMPRRADGSSAVTRHMPLLDAQHTVADAGVPGGGDTGQLLAGNGSEGRARCHNCFEPKDEATVCPGCGFDSAQPARPSPHLPPGTLLHGRYRIGKLLGQGGFGATYMGWDERLDVPVAIKEYFPVNLASRVPGSGSLIPYTPEHQASFKAGLTRFLDEARVLARLRVISEIVDVQDFFEDNATAYLVMEYLQGRTFKKYVADSGGKVEYRRALSILLPIMKALQDVHETGLVHRDISPDNIFVTATGGRKLLDFGAARLSTGKAVGALTVILKPGYAPPEQYFEDGQQGPWTDVYGISATLYAAILGKAPMDAARRLQRDDLVKPSESGVPLPREFETALLGGLTMRWQDRPRTMRALMTSFSKSLAA